MQRFLNLFVEYSLIPNVPFYAIHACVIRKNFNKSNFDGNGFSNRRNPVEIGQLGYRV